MKTKTRKAPSAGNHRITSPFAPYVFCLRNHSLLPGRLLNPGADVVRTVGDTHIVRKKARLLALSPAAAPCPEECEAADKALTKDIAGTKDPARLAVIAEHALQELARQARAGNGKALWNFSFLAYMCGQGLSEMMASNPKSFRPIAQDFQRWPMMRSTQPLLCDPDERLSKIHLGENVPVQLDKFSKWKIDAATKIADTILEDMRAMCKTGLLFWKDAQSEGRVPLAEYLGPFNKETVSRWWSVAWNYFSASYPAPAAIPELVSLVKSPSKLKSPGRIKQAVKDLLRQRFAALARP